MIKLSAINNFKVFRYGGNNLNEKEKIVYSVLEKLSINYEHYNHAPVATMDEINSLVDYIEDVHCKNLFLRNAKGNKHYLLLVEGSKNPDLKGLAKKIGSTRLSFGSKERLHKHLGLDPGAVSPLGLINDSTKNVEVLIDTDLIKSDKIAFHPNVNTASVVMSYWDFKKFLEWCGNKVQLVALNENS